MPNNKNKNPRHDATITSNVIEEILVQPSTIENIDRAMFEFIDEEMNIFCETNSGFKKTPVTWLATERAYQVKNNKDLRDENGVLILPLITIERTSISKNPANKGIFQAYMPPFLDKKGASITIGKVINQEKTSNFANKDAFRLMGQKNFPRQNNKVVYKNVSIPMPVYVEMMYQITLRTEYQQQMNQILMPFITQTGAINQFLLQRDGHKYEGFFQDSFSPNTNAASLGNEEKSYETNIQVRVLGYLIGKDKNQEQPKIVIRENAVEAKIPRERVITGDEPEHIDKRGFYTE